MTPEALRALPTAHARVACSGEGHTMRWEAGDLLPLDHDDPDGERALAALGGTSCACLDVLGAWARQRENPALLAVLSRGSQDQVHPEGIRWPYPVNPGGRRPLPRKLPGSASASNRTPGGWVALTASTQVGMTSYATAGAGMGASAGEPPTVESDLALLTGLGHELTLRLVATITAPLLEKLEGADGPAVRPTLEASLFGRVSCALRSWLATPHLQVDLRMTGPDEDPGLAWDGAATVQVALPPAWVLTVWGRDLTVLAGRFSLGVEEATATRTVLLTVGSDLGPARRLVVEVL